METLKIILGMYNEELITFIQMITMINVIGEYRSYQHAYGVQELQALS